MGGEVLEQVPCLGKVLCYRIVESREAEGVAYGLDVEYGGEHAAVFLLTHDRNEAKQLAERMARGRVTPTTFMDVVEDWLAR
jgi:hypothetical protein